MFSIKGLFILGILCMVIPVIGAFILKEYYKRKATNNQDVNKNLKYIVFVAFGLISLMTIFVGFFQKKGSPSNQIDSTSISSDNISSSVASRKEEVAIK